MVTAWRRAFCTSIPKDADSPVFSDQNHLSSAAANSPRISSKFGFFSNPSTPRLQSQPVSSPTLRCRTTAGAATTPTSSLPNSPKLQCKTSTPKKFLNISNPSSPKSPASFSFLKSAFRLSKGRCGVCLLSVKSGQGTAIFTAECGHVFHFPCVASHLNKNPDPGQNRVVLCPVCSSTWKELPLLSIRKNSEIKKSEEKIKEISKSKNLRVYNDDEPLMSPSSAASLFNPIPELEENDVEEADEAEFQGFFVAPAAVKSTKTVEVGLLPESSIVSVGRSYQTQVVVLKVKVPAPAAAPSSRRLPVDLVVVVDVSERMCGFKVQMMKRMMRLLISSLNSTDRLSIVAFSAASKRLLPLKRMTADGRRSVRRVVDALGSTGRGMSAIDALKKAAKVIEDRRAKNPVATIIVLSNGQYDRFHTRSSSLVTSTRFDKTPVHSVNFDKISASNTHHEDAIAKCLTGLLTIAVQELNLEIGVATGSSPAEIAAVYPLAGQPIVFGPGSVRVGDLYAEEDRELLVELKVSGSSTRAHQILSVRSSFKDPLTQEAILCKPQSLLVPRPQAVRSSLPNIKRLRDLHISTRAIAESRRLTELNDLSGAYHLLSSARALLMQSSDGSASEHVRGLEAELGELHRRRQQTAQGQSQRSSQQVEEKAEPLTPTSAWRAAEKLAKVAIMRKHMNRVSDLHGFENARF